MAIVSAKYEVLLEKYPDYVEEVMSKIRSGKSKHKDDPPDSFNWQFSWWTVYFGSPYKPSKDDKVNYMLENSYCSIRAQKGKFNYSWYSKQLPDLPQEVADEISGSIV